MKVLLAVRWPVGGIRTYLKYVLNLLPDDEFDFYVLTTGGKDSEILHGDIAGRIKEWRIVHPGKNFLYNFSREIVEVIKLNNIDFVHAHGFTSAIVSFFPCLISKRKLILTSHDVFNNLQFKGVKGRLKKIAFSAILSRCDVIQSVSHDAEENLYTYFPKISCIKSKVILNGIESQVFLNAKAVDLKRQLSLHEDIFLIGFFGRFMNQKGFKYLVDAISILRRSGLGKFHVVSFGDGAFIREEKAFIKRLGLEAFFSFLPFTTDVSGMMKGCDVIAMPSLWEACPLQPMEALTAGVPFVGSRCIGLREVLNGTPAIQVEPADAKSLADGILECVRKGSSPFKEYSGVAAKRFSVEKTARDVCEMYKDNMVPSSAKLTNS